MLTSQANFSESLVLGLTVQTSNFVCPPGKLVAAISIALYRPYRIRVHSQVPAKKIPLMILMIYALYLDHRRPLPM